uniref:Sidekick cell adhesion molecule 2 n=1 Tax=Hucho hucho TaxID=62062 RepID=A0A4W5NYF9_9TELE
ISPVKMPRYRVLVGGSLQINGLLPDDTGMFQCFARNLAGEIQTNTYLAVTISPSPFPPTLISSFLLTRCHHHVPMSIPLSLFLSPPFLRLSSLLLLSVSQTCHAAHSDAPWTVLLANIEPESTGVTVGGLIPARSYQFRLCAVNDVGRGQFSKETDRLSLPEEPPSAPPQTVIASGRTNQSIMIQWQPPPESQQNGPLQGYIIRYCLSGLPVDCQMKNITRPDQNNLLLEELIIWTNYEIEVAAYNRAGRGTYSHKVTEWTLQGVPTVPPGNVQAEPFNSSTVRLTWSAPSPQFINGINQGYKLLAWEAGHEEDVTMVTVRPNFQDSVHVGYVKGLKKFTEYYTSVLCFTTPGDGPRSPPHRLRTHEDTPGAVGHLSFTEILDTSLKVSWEDPNEKNGVLTGYRISWEEFNRTNTRVTHYLPNLTQEYRVTGLTALTTYTIQVAGMTSKGQGQLSSSTISSGVPPGYIAPTRTSCQTHDDIHTFLSVLPCRFRMRQMNIVGTSPPSQPSRKIQTLQAPPDISPYNVTLRTASETSLWLRWVPLPEWEYNGDQELVGYRVQYSRAASKEGVLSHVISDRLEREFTIEDLEEWTEYEVRVQAINGMGSGPWSQPVQGRTRESVPSCGPTNVSAFATTSSSILVRWGEVPQTDRNGLILGYKVVYKDKGSDSVPQCWEVEGNTSHSVQLSGLGKYVLYEIQVLAFTRIGDGRSSKPSILERTLDDVPGPPVGILFPEVRTGSVRLIWQTPAQPNGIILAYQITHRRNTSNSNAATVDVLNPSARQYTASGLKPESVYVFRLTAQTRKGWGEAAEALVVTTEKRARPQPASRPTVPQEDVQARSVMLSWEPGSDGLSPVRYYTVQYRELPDSNWTVHSASVNHEASSYIVDSLKPFTSYQFRVKVTNDIGDSEYSQESEAVTTLQDGKDIMEMRLTDSANSLYQIFFKSCKYFESLLKSINGVLLGFRVRYRELQYDRLRSFTIRTINSPASNWAELTGEQFVNNSFCVSPPTDLSKHKRYEIRLSVYNAVGEGPTSTPQEVFVGEAAPPQTVTIQSSTATQLDVTWSPPPLDSQNGDIQGYKIYFWEFQLQNETERLRTMFLPELGVKIKNLTGYTTYMISVAAFNAAGDGPRSPPTRGRTQQAAPSRPSFLHFSELTTTSVNMSWGEPGQANGIIEGYRLVYEPCTPVDGVSKIVTVDVKGSTPLWMKIKDLADGVTYNFRIRAKTLTYGPEVEANITTGPGEGEPFISRYGTALTLHWTSGDPGRAPITRYVIEARPSDEGLWDILIKDIPKEVTSYTLNLDMLREGVNYDFRVIGVNDYGYGSPSGPSPSISAQKVSPFYEEWWFLVVIALVGLIFILLLVFILIIRGQSKKYTKKADSVLIPQLKPLFLFVQPQGSDSEYEVDQNRGGQQKTHSFVNHYISDPTYYNSWRRQQKGVSRPPAYGYAQPEPLHPHPLPYCAG